MIIRESARHHAGLTFVATNTHRQSLMAESARVGDCLFSTDYESELAKRYDAVTKHLNVIRFRRFVRRHITL
jgi:hypothetical protein